MKDLYELPALSILIVIKSLKRERPVEVEQIKKALRLGFGRLQLHGHGLPVPVWSTVLRDASWAWFA